METILNRLSYATAYMDDKIVVGTSVDEHRTYLAEVFARTQPHRSHLRMEKYVSASSCGKLCLADGI